MVDRGGLENRCTLAGTQGSNPCLSAGSRRVASLRLATRLTLAKAKEWMTPGS